MSRTVQTMFDRIAPTYDALNRTLSLGIDRRWRRLAVDALGDLSYARVLDLCAGTGDLANEVKKRCPTAYVIATDFSSAMLVAGKKSGKIDGSAVRADALRLPFPDRKFDAAICGFGVRNLDDPLTGLREAVRVLAPGGRFVVLDFFRPTTRARRILHAIYDRNVLPAVGGLVSGDASAYRYLASSMTRFVTRIGYEALARDAGFTVERSEDLFPGGIASLLLLRKPREVSSC
jgi:ubiquinone/menaquinone biosynthesis methyltransferase